MATLRGVFREFSVGCPNFRIWLSVEAHFPLFGSLYNHIPPHKWKIRVSVRKQDREIEFQMISEGGYSESGGGVRPVAS